MFLHLIHRLRSSASTSFRAQWRPPPRSKRGTVPDISLSMAVQEGESIAMRCNEYQYKSCGDCSTPGAPTPWSLTHLFDLQYPAVMNTPTSRRMVGLGPRMDRVTVRVRSQRWPSGLSPSRPLRGELRSERVRSVAAEKTRCSVGE